MTLRLILVFFERAKKGLILMPFLRSEVMRCDFLEIFVVECGSILGSDSMRFRLFMGNVYYNLSFLHLSQP